MQTLTMEAADLVVGGGDAAGMASAAGIGAGIGADIAIRSVGGWGGLQKLGTAAPGVMGAAAVGVATAGTVGYKVGSYLNEYEAVRETARGSVEEVMENGFWPTVGDGFSKLGIWILSNLKNG